MLYSNTCGAYSLNSLPVATSASQLHRIWLLKLAASPCSPSSSHRPWGWRRLSQMCWVPLVVVPLRAHRPCSELRLMGWQLVLGPANEWMLFWCLTTRASCGRQLILHLMMRLGWMGLALVSRAHHWFVQIGGISWAFLAWTKAGIAGPQGAGRVLSIEPIAGLGRAVKSCSQRQFVDLCTHPVSPVTCVIFGILICSRVL